MSHDPIVEGAAEYDPISIGITRHVKRDHIVAFEAWLDEIKVSAGSFEGYAGMDVVRPAGADNPTYVIILRFDSHEHYRAWHESPERRITVEQSLAMTTGDPTIEVARGLEAWFTAPSAQARMERPARYKMTILTIVGLYPLILGSGALVAAATRLPVVLGTLVTVTAVAALATYWVMPWVTRVAHHWLYPAEPTEGSS